VPPAVPRARTGRRPAALGTLRRAALLLALAAATLAAASCGGGAAERDVIIVSGASGQLGRLVVEELLARGVSPSRLILVSRTPEELGGYAAMGARTRFGDFTRPESLLEAYAGGDRMLLISIDTGVGAERADLHVNAIDAAVAAGVRHVAYTSFVDLDNNDSPLAADHLRTERALRDSGLDWTMLRNSLYMNGLVARAQRMLADGRVVASDTGGVAYVTREDCAAAAAAVLATDGHEFRAYDITGPAVVLPQDIARAVSEVTGRPIEILAPEAGAAPAGGPLSSPSFSVVSTAVEDLTGRPAMTVRDLLETHRDDLSGAGR
jgi:NAD(P)H dehydrogenase (quinone)